MFKNDNQIGQEYWQKTNIITEEVRRICEKFGNSTIKSREKPPKLMFRHGSINSDISLCMAKI